MEALITKAKQFLLDAIHGNPCELPSLAGSNEWLNSVPLTPAGLRGKVVLVEFWT